jgi:uncharacterized membrane protein YtjA (UPF0391 family)
LFVIFLAIFVFALVVGAARRWPPPV